MQHGALLGEGSTVLGKNTLALLEFPFRFELL